MIRLRPPNLVVLMIVLVIAVSGAALVALPSVASAQATQTRDGGDSQNVVGGIGGDPLRRNGLISPFCRGGSPLTARQAANCRASGSPASPVPIGNYQFDVHINTSLVGLGAADAALVLQNIVIQPVWILLLWLTQGVTVVLGWCFTLNLFDRSTMGPVAEALNDARRLFTRPWLQLTLLLSVAPLLYHAVLRRRAGQGLTQLVLTILMLAFGFWVIANPFASVGLMADGVQKSSLATVSAFSTGRVSNPEIDFNRAMERLFETAVKRPYAYLEFGDVSWGTDPERRDRRLFSQKSIEGAVAANLGSTFSDLCSGNVLQCANQLKDDDFVAQMKASMAGQITQARTAKTNADLFLVFPANGKARNSINDDDSLFKTLCQPKGGDKECSGNTRHEANFRKQGQTFSRLAGLALIAFGLAGLVMLLGYIALRLLRAALFALFYLLCTPVAVVLAPLGPAGQRHFRTWAIRLFGSIITKLIFSVFLGIVFLVVRVLSEMGELGFWTQWFLIGAFYWMCWVHREELLSFLQIGHEEMGRRSASALGELFAARMAARSVGNVARSGTRAARAAATGARRTATGAADIARNSRAERTLAVGEKAHATAAATSEAAKVDRTEQTDRSMHNELAAHRKNAEPVTRRRRLSERLAQRHAEAIERGDTEGAERLSRWQSRAEQSLAARRLARPLRAASDDIVNAADQRMAQTGSPLHVREREDRSRWLDQQAETPARAGTAAEVANGTARDYRRLARLADPTMGARQYDALAPAQRARIHQAVNAELTRRQAGAALLAAGSAPTPDLVQKFAAAEQATRGGPGTPSAAGQADGRAREQMQRERIRRQFGAIDREMQDRWRDRHVSRRRTRDRRPARTR